MGVMKDSSKYAIHSVEKACDILSSFDEENTEIGITELSKKLGLTKSTVHKILLTLEMKGFVAQNESNGKYGLSTKFFEIACNYLNKLNVNDVIKPYMEKLSQEFNETVHFAVLDDYEVVYVEKIQGTHPISIYSRIGRRSPIHCPAVGKVILANLPESKIVDIIDKRGLKKYTEHTITERAKLFDELNKIRLNGYAIDDEEYEIGIRCVGVPIKNATGKLIGGLSISGPTGRMTSEKIANIIPVLLKSAAEISQKLVHKS